MNTELTVHPLTGEALDLRSAPIEQIAHFLDSVREYQRILNEAKRIVSDEIIKRMDHEGQWSIRADHYQLKSSSPQPKEEWDELALRSDLLELADAGVISPQLVDDAVEPVVTYRVKKSGINRLRKLRSPVPEVVDRHARTVEPNRYVSISL